MHVCDFVDILPCVPSPSLGPLAAVTGSPPDVPSPFSSSASDSAPLPKGNLSPATARMCRGVNVREPTPLGQLSTNGAESVDKCPGFPRLCARFYIGFYTTSQINPFNCLLIDRTFIGFSPFCLNCSVPSLLFLCVTSQVNYRSKVIVVSGTVVGGGCKSGTDRLTSVNNSWWNYISYWPWAWKPKLMTSYKTRSENNSQKQFISLLRAASLLFCAFTASIFPIISCSVVISILLTSQGTFLRPLESFGEVKIHIFFRYRHFFP